MSSTAITISKQSQASNPTREHKALAAARRKGPGVVRQRAGEPPKCAACGSIPPLPSTASSQGGWPHRPRYLWGSRCACPLQTCPWSPGCWSCGGQGRAARRKPAAVSSAGAAAFLRASLCSHSHAQDVRNGGWRGGGTQGKAPWLSQASGVEIMPCVPSPAPPDLPWANSLSSWPPPALPCSKLAWPREESRLPGVPLTRQPAQAGAFTAPSAPRAGAAGRSRVRVCLRQEGEAGTDLETCASPPTHLPQGTGRGIRPRTGCFKADKRDG